MFPVSFFDTVELMLGVKAPHVGVVCSRRRSRPKASRSPLEGPEEALLPPLFHMPVELQSCIAATAGVTATRRLSLVSRQAFSEVWNSHSTWRAISCSSDAAPDTIRRSMASDCSLHQLQSTVRRRLCGIDTLTTVETTGPTTMSELVCARRAIRALCAKDGVALIERVAVSVAALLRRRCRDCSSEVLDCDMENAANELLEQAALSELFTTSDMLSMVGAQQEAELRIMLCADQEAYLLTSLEMLEESGYAQGADDLLTFLENPEEADRHSPECC